PATTLLARVHHRHRAQEARPSSRSAPRADVATLQRHHELARVPFDRRTSLVPAAIATSSHRRNENPLGLLPRLARPWNTVVPIANTQSRSRASRDAQGSRYDDLGSFPPELFAG